MISPLQEFGLGGAVALFGATLTAMGACGTVVAILVRMRRDIDSERQARETLSSDVKEIKAALAQQGKEITDFRVGTARDMGELKSAIAAWRPGHQNNPSEQQH